MPLGAKVRRPAVVGRGLRTLVQMGAANRFPGFLLRAEFSDLEDKYAIVHNITWADRDAKCQPQGSRFPTLRQGHGMRTPIRS